MTPQTLVALIFIAAILLIAVSASRLAGRADRQSQEAWERRRMNDEMQDPKWWGT